jgi:hypothetical protein
VPEQTPNVAAAALAGGGGVGPQQESIATQGPGTPTAEAAAREDAMAAAAFSQEPRKPQRVRKTRRTSPTTTVRRERDDEGDSGLKKGLKKMFSPFGKLFGVGKKKEKNNGKDRS